MADFEHISPEARGAWDRLSAIWREPLKVNSAYRSPERNAAVGGAKHSQHMHGNAFDVDVSGMSRDERLRLIADAKQAGFRGVGVYNNALHFDVGPERAWGPDYHRGSIPDWARGAVGAPAAAPAGQGGGYIQMGQVAPPAASEQPQQQERQPFQFQNVLQDPAAFMARPVNQLAPGGGFAVEGNPFLSYLRKA